LLKPFLRAVRLRRDFVHDLADALQFSGHGQIW
jgi:hypothetical protein